MTKYSFDISKVISWSNREAAQKYLKKKGYFGNSLDDLEIAIINENFSNCGACIDLNKITDEVICFVIGTDWNDYYQNYAYGLFLPAEE